MLALVYFVKYFKHYLLGREFILITDHGSLVWLHKFREPDGQVARWLQKLGPYVFQIVHRPGKRHGKADALSRIDNEMCKQCKRDTHVNWSEEKFTHIVELRKLYENRDDYKHDRKVLDI